MWRRNLEWTHREKYRYATTTNTSTSAGRSTQKLSCTSKSTGLPLRSELYTEPPVTCRPKGSKNVPNESITTTVDDSLFQVPSGLSKFHLSSARTDRCNLKPVAAVISAVEQHDITARLFADDGAITRGNAQTSPSPRASNTMKYLFMLVLDSSSGRTGDIFARSPASKRSLGCFASAAAAEIPPRTVVVALSDIFLTNAGSVS